MKLGFALGCLVVWSVSLLGACGGDDDDGGGGTGGGTATGGAGGSGGATGDSGACKTCSQMVATAEADLTKACSGQSATLIQAFVTCTCQTDVCGGPGKGCEAACAQTGPIDSACQACDQTAAAGPCKTQFDACMADI